MPRADDAPRMAVARRRRHAALIAVGILPWMTAVGWADTSVTCELLYQTADGFYVDAGRSSGVTAGRHAEIEFEGERIARVVIADAGEGSAFLTVVGESDLQLPPRGAIVTLVLEGDPDLPAPVPPRRASSSGTLKDRTAEDDDFVPLLAPPDMSETGVTGTDNIFHGRMTFGNIFQFNEEDDLDFIRTRVNTTGTVERINGGPWALEWSGDFTYREGDGLANHPHYQEVHPQVYRLSLYRRYDDRSNVRIGRFVPRELPSVGFLDGFQGEKVLNERWRVGTMVGFKPDRIDLAPRYDEPTIVPYGTFEAGDRRGTHYSATTGFLGSYYEGDLDRLAILTDQSLRWRNLSIFSSTEVDFDSGEGPTQEDVELTRWDLTTSLGLGRLLTLRAGLDRYERPDTEAERDAIDLQIAPEQDFFEQGYWRYWAGARHELFWGFVLDEQVAYTVPDDDGQDEETRWVVSLTKRRLPFFSRGSATLNVYNLNGESIEGYGSRFTATLPTKDHRFILEPSIAFQYGEFEIDDDFFDFTDVSIQGHWLGGESWSFTGGMSYAFTEDDQRLSVNFSITYRW